MEHDTCWSIPVGIFLGAQTELRNGKRARCLSTYLFTSHYTV